MNTRQQLIQDMIQALPSESYYKIFHLPSTTELQLLQKMNQSYNDHPKGTYRVTLPNTHIIKLILTPILLKQKKNLDY